jgi:hypothetical protein
MCSRQMSPVVVPCPGPSSFTLTFGKTIRAQAIVEVTRALDCHCCRHIPEPHFAVKGAALRLAEWLSQGNVARTRSSGNHDPNVVRALAVAQVPCWDFSAVSSLCLYSIPAGRCYCSHCFTNRETEAQYRSVNTVYGFIASRCT